MKVIARDRFNTSHDAGTDVAVYQDGIGIRQSMGPYGQQDIFLDFDSIERIAKLARRHKTQAERLTQ
jgi:hypothetical protein